MLDKRYRRFIQSFLLVLPMSALVTAINTLVARGLTAIFTFATLQRWLISVVIAFPAVLLIAPLAVKVTDRIIKND